MISYYRYHTEVPSNYQGKGLAAILAKVKNMQSLSLVFFLFFNFLLKYFSNLQAAFDYAVENQLSMKLSCTYLQKYLKDNPKDEYKQLVLN